MVNVAKEPSIRGPVLFGIIILLVFVGGFVLWSALAPLDSAAVAQGQIIVDTNRKTIEHLEGGVIEGIYVVDGSKVEAGDLLMKIDDTQARARLSLLNRQMTEYLSQGARLVAERDKQEEIKFPKMLLDQLPDEEIEKVMKAQESLFTAENNTFTGQLKILNQGITQLEKEIESLEAQASSKTQQLELINEEIEAVAYLEAKKLIERPRLLALQREAARLAGEHGEALGMISRAEQRIGEVESRVFSLDDTRRQEILENLQEVQLNLNNVQKERDSAIDVLRRTKIVAPQRGTVVGLQKHTIGGVVSPSEEIMELVPSEDDLIIEVRIDPLDIDVVHPGLLAKVQLTAFKQRTTPALSGEVTHVSADSLQDQQSGQMYYNARVVINKEDLAKLDDIQLYPGMPAQVMIIIDKSTPMQYFITPIRESFQRAFREQ